MNKCPACGYEKAKYNPSTRIRELRGKRSKPTKNIIRKAINNIQVNVPSDNNTQSEYYFYQSISKIEDMALEWVINQFIQSKHYLKGKGFKYLTAMCLNHDKNRRTISQNELLRRGKSPSIVQIGSEK